MINEVRDEAGDHRKQAGTQDRAGHLVPEQRIVFHQEKPLVRAPPNTVARPEVFVSAVFFGGLCSAAVYPLYRGKSISRKTGPRTRGITPHSHRKPMTLPDRKSTRLNSSH